METYDYIIIGTGAGGGTIAHELAQTGKKILILERGDFLPRENENWLPESVFVEGRYGPKEEWLDKADKKFTPGTHYFVGGNTKFYGAVLLRLREQDFGEIKHYDGVSPAWPLSYSDMQPYYMEAEQLYEVHGERGKDPVEPPENEPYSFPAVSHEPIIQQFYDIFEKEGLKPFHLPLGIRLDEKNPLTSRCVRCETCDGYPCLVNAKSDSQHMCLMKILNRDTVTLITKAKAVRLHTDSSGKKVTQVEVEREGKREMFQANTFIVSCGAINSAALFLKSANEHHPTGLANSSDLVGRNYMYHKNTVVLSLLSQENKTKYPKTLGCNAFYFNAPDSEFPLGHIQMLGKVAAGMLRGDAPFFVPDFVLEKMARHSVGWWITSEDLPDPNNRISVTTEGQIKISYTNNNEEAHNRLYKKLREILKKGKRQFPRMVQLKKRIPIGGVAHQVGTMRFGRDPKTSVLDIHCKTHDLENVYVVDGSFFPSSGAVNPALTIIANAIRVGKHLRSL